MSTRSIADEVMSWPGVTAPDHRFGGLEFRLGARQLGHLHGNRIADIPLKRSLRDELVVAGRVRVHRWRPDSGWVTVDIDTDAGRDEAVRLLRTGYASALRAPPAPGRRPRRRLSASDAPPLDRLGGVGLPVVTEQERTLSAVAEPA